MKKMFLILVSIIFFPYLSTSSKIEFCADCWGNNCAYCTTPSVQGPDPTQPIFGGGNYPKYCSQSIKMSWKFDLLPIINTMGLYELTRHSANGPSNGSVNHLPSGTNVVPFSRINLGGHGWASDDLVVYGHFWVEVVSNIKLGPIPGIGTLMSSMTIPVNFPQSCC